MSEENNYVVKLDDVRNITITCHTDDVDTFLRILREHADDNEFAWPFDTRIED